MKKKIQKDDLHEAFGEDKGSVGLELIGGFIGQQRIELLLGEVCILEEFFVGGGLLPEELRTRLSLFCQAIKFGNLSSETLSFLF